MASTPSPLGQRSPSQDSPPLSAYLTHGDVFRTLGLPDNFVVGLDTMAMTTNRSLSGFRDIPPGAHFLWVQQPHGVSRCGYWFTTREPGILRTKQWDSSDEVLREPESQLETQSHKDKLQSVYAALQPYTLSTHKDHTRVSLDDTYPDWARSPLSLWSTLTSAISTQVLARITGEQGVTEYLVDSVDCAKDTHLGELFSATTATGCTSTANPNSSNKLTFLFTQDLRDLQVLDLGPVSAQVSDTTGRIQAAITSPVTEQTILGELQFAFLTGTHLGNPACLEHWVRRLPRQRFRIYPKKTKN